MLEISEIFHSIQGEGPFMGQPAVFLRLSGCVPPFCPWCDSTFALKRGKQEPIDTIEKKILSLKSDLVVITGGEPFLQWDKGLSQLVNKLARHGLRIQYETSGKAGIPENNKGFVVWSPKIDFSQKLDRTLVKLADAVKFVVDENFDEIIKTVELYGIPKTKIWLMPLGETREKQINRMQKVWEFAVRHGMNFSPRLQILVFNIKQGV